MRVTECIKAHRCGHEVELLFRPSSRMRGKCDLSDFDCGTIVVARQGGLSVSDTAALQGFSCTKVFTENGAENKQ